MLLLPATAATVAGFLAAAEAAPDGLTTIANVMNCRPLPFVPPEPPEPPEPHGSIVILALVCWAGDTAAGLEAMAPFLALAEPIANLVAPMLYPQIFPPEDPDYHPTAVSRTMFVDSVGPDEATTIVELLQASDATLRVAQLRVLGGGVARVPARCLRQLPPGRGPGADPRRLPRRHLGPACRRQGDLRPAERVPAEPERATCRGPIAAVTAGGRRPRRP
jgi:hypothetical protein